MLPTTTVAAPVPAAPSAPARAHPSLTLTSRRRAKPRTPQLTATSRRTPFDTDTRPPLHALTLPGPRREQEGRGGATSNLTVLRLIIRSPLLAAWAAAVPARTKGRPASVPDVFYLFYLQATRRMGSQERLDQELRENWTHIREEFWFVHGVLLPDAKPNGDVTNSDDLRKWRERVVVNPARPLLPELARRLTQVSLPLALAIRRAEGGDGPRPLHDPGVWDLLAVDGTVMDVPSDVRRIEEHDEWGNVVNVRFEGSRAKDPARARWHHEVTTVSKKHGATKGLFNVVAVSRGVDTYTRVVLGAEIGGPGEGEDPVAMRMLRGVYDEVGTTFPVLLYDGAMKPTYFQELMADYGIYCVNANTARPAPRKNSLTAATEPVVTPGPDGPRTPLGIGRRRYGVARGQMKRTFTMPLPSVLHEADGYQHHHHLTADDGAVYETNRPALSGGDVHKTGLLTPVGLERRRSDTGEYSLLLTLEGSCSHGDPYTVSYELARTALDKDGHLPWRTLVANVRVIPDALVDRFGSVYGQRNIIESFFSWLEGCFTLKDRHASWGRDLQQLDLLAASMLHNTLAWAHVAYRHPEHAQALAHDLAGLDRPRPADAAPVA